MPAVAVPRERGVEPSAPLLACERDPSSELELRCMPSAGAVAEEAPWRGATRLLLLAGRRAVDERTAARSESHETRPPPPPRPVDAGVTATATGGRSCCSGACAAAAGASAANRVAEIRGPCHTGRPPVPSSSGGGRDGVRSAGVGGVASPTPRPPSERDSGIESSDTIAGRRSCCLR